MKRKREREEMKKDAKVSERRMWKDARVQLTSGLGGSEKLEKRI